jgi:hypothetical protein
MQDEKPDYDDWSDQDLSDELKHVDELIEAYQASLVQVRKNLNRNMETRENLLDAIRIRAHQRKGWKK